MLTDIENIIFTKIAVRLRTEVEGVFVVGESQSVPARFPCVTLMEADNYVYEKSQTAQIENHANLMYEASAYSNLASGKKAQCKKMMQIIDEEMAQLGFTRIMKQTVPNIEDASICRMTARYRGIQDKENRIYQK